MDRMHSAIRRLAGVVVLAAFAYFYKTNVSLEDPGPVPSSMMLTVLLLLAWEIGVVVYGMCLLVAGKPLLAFDGVLLLLWVSLLSIGTWYASDMGRSFDPRVLLQPSLGSLLLVPVVAIALDCILCFLEHRRKTR